MVYGSKCQYAGRLAVAMEVHGMAGSCFMMSFLRCITYDRLEGLGYMKHFFTIYG